MKTLQAPEATSRTVISLAMGKGSKDRTDRELVLEVDQVVVEPGPERLRLVPLRLCKLGGLRTLQRFAPLTLNC